MPLSAIAGPLSFVSWTVSFAYKRSQVDLRGALGMLSILDPAAGGLVGWLALLQLAGWLA